MTFTRSSSSSNTSGATCGLAGALLSLREVAGLKIYAVCKATGLSRSVVENAEAAGTPKFGVLVVLADFYGFDHTSDLVALGEVDEAERRNRITKHAARHSARHQHAA